MEMAQASRKVIINAIKAPEKDAEALYSDARPIPAVPWKDRMILPPFLGEMGFEIRYFLAAVEPWLRNGWRILAKRPEFYPEGTAFNDPDLFAEMTAAIVQHRGRAIGGAIRPPGETAGISMQSSLMEDGRYVVEMHCAGQAEIASMLDSALLETKLRRAFAHRYMRAPRPITPWDTNLLTTFDSRPEHLCGGALAFAPTYKPASFIAPPYPAYPHVGVQMRRLPQMPDRDSDPGLMLGAAQAAADHLGLPLLVYGHPDGTFRPEGLLNTADLAADRPLLRFELSMLSQCRLMLAPESGWCDLMCWLQVPTLLEKLGRPHEFTHNGVFRPRLGLLDQARPVAPQVEVLFAAGESLPSRPSQPDVPDDMDWDGSRIRTVGNRYIFSV